MDKLTGDNITQDQIEQLRTEAAAAGDTEMVRICDAAYGRASGSPTARQKCADAINAARAMAEA